MRPGGRDGGLRKTCHHETNSVLRVGPAILMVEATWSLFITAEGRKEENHISKLNLREH